MSRWPIIRHLRFVIARAVLRRRVARLYRLGIGLGRLAARDDENLAAIWRGES